MDEKQGVKLDQDDLGNVAGGEKSSGGRCLFTPTGQVKTIYGQKWAQCNSYCALIPGMERCPCHDNSKNNNCTDKWHKVDENEELLPREAANHKNKPKSNNYNT